MDQKILVSSLAVSVILNAFAAGVFVSHIGDHRRPMMPFMEPGRERDARIMKDLEVLKPEYRARVEDIIKKHHDGARSHMDFMRDSFKEINSVLTAPKFDEGKLIAINKKIELKDTDIKGNMSGMIMDIAKILPDDERIKFFKNTMHDRPDGPMGPMDGPRFDDRNHMKDMDKDGRAPDFKGGDKPSDERKTEEK